MNCKSLFRADVGYQLMQMYSFELNICFYSAIVYFNNQSHFVGISHL